MLRSNSAFLPLDTHHAYRRRAERDATADRCVIAKRVVAEFKQIDRLIIEAMRKDCGHFAQHFPPHTTIFIVFAFSDEREASADSDFVHTESLRVGSVHSGHHRRTEYCQDETRKHTTSAVQTLKIPASAGIDKRMADRLAIVFSRLNLAKCLLMFNGRSVVADPSPSAERHRFPLATVFLRPVIVIYREVRFPPELTGGHCYVRFRPNVETR
ncbi:hypothetical protein [Caballeronia sp. GAFFF1]|uniref:hypothetical protein n=1 Tax=Caballeronia sp. GAFFF1 TaxID=2921779 RepID=UPI002027CC22|nr:hypothetical protein [Caballeronia sp. GAFFF1]